MNTSNRFKSPDVLVLRQRNGSGLRLVHQITKQTQTLDRGQASSWANWEDGLVGHSQRGNIEQSLVSGEFIIPNNISALRLEVSELDSCVPAIKGRNVKWYEESTDLFILFNTKLLPYNNPLLALGPYGSLCWHKVVSGWSIYQIRREALRVFGCDEVIPFLKRLADLDFIEQINGLDRILLQEQRVTKEFYAPNVQLQLSQSAIPWYCLWEICTTCDLRCKICYLPHFKDPGPDSESAWRVAQQIINAGIFYVGLLGGEPLVRNDLEEVIGHLRKAGVFVKIISNGQKLTLNRAKALADTGLNQIEISFDGLSVQTHESSRGLGTYALASQAIHNARAAGIPRLGMVWTIHSGNFDELASLPEFMHKQCISECYLSLFKKTGLNGAQAPFNPIGPNDVLSLQRTVKNWKKEQSQLEIVLLPSCSCGRTSAVIGHNGDVRLCSFSYSSVGNIHQSSLLDIWRSLEAGMPETGPLGYCTRGESGKGLTTFTCK